MERQHCGLQQPVSIPSARTLGLINNELKVGDQNAFFLANIQNASLTNADGISGNTVNIAGWTGSRTVSIFGGNDSIRLLAANDVWRDAVGTRCSLARWVATPRSRT